MTIISLHDYLRPWKLFSLSCGIAILLTGSVIEQAMDWDFTISFLMAIGTYLTSIRYKKSFNLLKKYKQIRNLQ